MQHAAFRFSAVDAALPAVALLSVLPRLTQLGRSLWNDETFATHLRLGFNRGTLAWMAYDTHPPLYSLLMLLWTRAFGDSERSIRMFPLLCSVASVLLIGKVAASLLGRGGGLLAAAALALSGASVFYAQEARSYSFLVTVLLLMTWFLVRYWRDGRPRDLRGFFVCAVVGGLTHVYALLFVTLFLVLLALTVPRDAGAGPQVLRLALAGVALAVPTYFLIALMILFTGEHSYLWRGITSEFGGREAAALISFYLFGHGGLTGKPLVGLAACALFLGGVYAAWRRSSERPSGREPSAHDYRLPEARWLFATAVAFGVVLVLAAVAAPVWLTPEALGRLVGPNRHPELLAALPPLLRRTGLLYLAAYAGLAAAWGLLSGRHGARLGRAFDGARARLGLPAPTPGRVITGFPLFAVALVLFISRFRPTYNNRYMTALMPFVVIGVSAAVWRSMASRATRAALAATLLAAQAYSLTRQEEAYALLKPDYRGALKYLGGTEAARYPITGTAQWELENLSRYYADRGEIGRLKIVTRSEALGEERVAVIVPQAYPLEAPHLAELRELVRSGTTTTVRFPGLTVYEVSRGAH